MFKQLISRIKEDDNPRLHRIPFFFVWIASYGLGWFVLRLYESLNYDSRFCEIHRWLRGYQYYYSPEETWWREDLLLGVLFAIVVSVTQTWILKQRYGYVPRFWRLAVFIGAIVAGFGYPRVGIADYLTSSSSLTKSTFLVDFLIWFTVLNLFQAVVMMRVNRRAWQIIVVGLVAGLSACAIYYFGLAGIVSAKIGLIAGLGIQIIGTGFVMMRLMAEPREGIIPKRDETEKSKNSTSDGIRPVTFVALWTGAYFMARMVLTLMWQLYGITWRMPAFYDFNRWLFYDIKLGWILNAMFYIVFGLVLAIAQKWLMQKYYGVRVQRWILFSTIGWSIAGICLAHYYYPYSQNDTWLAGYFIIPTLFQTLPMMRTMRRGWFWLTAGCVSTIVAILFPAHYYHYWMHNYYGFLIGGLVLSLSTAIIFLFLQAKTTDVPEKLKHVEEIVY